jgi:transcriptional regulator with XRE-family HTH domain
MRGVQQHRFSGSRLAYWRERAGLTTPLLSARCEELGRRISKQQIARLENGESNPRATTLAILARALGREIDDLCDNSGGAVA